MLNLDSTQKVNLNSNTKQKADEAATNDYKQILQEALNETKMNGLPRTTQAEDDKHLERKRRAGEGGQGKSWN